MEGINPNSCTKSSGLEKKARPQEQLNCPRCNSTNTKFCYYNNYSLTQPRYFCKTCRRYWTEGGSLRNVPVGGGSRKNKKITNPATPSPKVPDLNPPSFSTVSSQNPKIQGGQDLNLALPAMEKYNHGESSHQNSPSAATSLSALELLRTGMAASRGLNIANYVPPLMQSSNSLYPSGFPMQEIKPSVGFSIDGIGNRYGVQENANGRILFPFGDHLKQLSGNEVEQNKGQGSSTGYWTGMIGEGSW